MIRLTIQPLTQLNVAQLWKLVRGYTTTEKYIVTKQETELEFIDPPSGLVPVSGSDIVVQLKVVPH